MKPEVRKLMENAQEARGKLRRGLINYEGAVSIVEKYAEVYNTKAKAVAKEYGVKFKPMSIKAFLR